MKKMSLAILVFAACGLSATAQQNKTAKKKIAAFSQTAPAAPSQTQSDVAKRTAEKQRIEAGKKAPRVSTPSSEKATNGNTN